MTRPLPGWFLTAAGWVIVTCAVSWSLVSPRGRRNAKAWRDYARAHGQ